YTSAVNPSRDYSIITKAITEFDRVVNRMGRGPFFQFPDAGASSVVYDKAGGVVILRNKKTELGRFTFKKSESQLLTSSLTAGVGAQWRGSIVVSGKPLTSTGFSMTEQMPSRRRK